MLNLSKISSKCFEVQSKEIFQYRQTFFPSFCGGVLPGWVAARPAEGKQTGISAERVAVTVP
jgi:hypothetical protein